VIAQAGIWIVSIHLHIGRTHTDLSTANSYNLGWDIQQQTRPTLLSPSCKPLPYPQRIPTNLPHQLLNSAGVLLTTQAILVLQPTHTPKQKKQGTNIHAVLNGTALLSLLAGLIIIEYNKFDHDGDHFASPHAILGLITYILLIVQALVGITQYYIPSLYGGVDNAKAIWKYHRMSGYLLLVMFFVTIAAATQTDFNKKTLHIQLWAVVVAALLTLVGVLPRIKKQKLGLS